MENESEGLGSITRWISDLKNGDAEAATPLWRRYAPRLVHLARQKLAGVAQPISDEEDAVLSAFESFCRGAIEGNFDELTNRMELWRLLTVITLRKSVNQIQNAKRLKRGGGEKIESIDHELAALTTTPDFIASAAEQYQRLLEALDDDQLLRRFPRRRRQGPRPGESRPRRAYRTAG